jgi:hypothetical protein
MLHDFLRIWVSVYYYFPLPETLCLEFSVIQVCCWQISLVFFLSEKAFILSEFWNNRFTVNRILGWQHFPLYTLKQRNGVWWNTPVIPELGRLRQEDHEVKVSLGYIGRCCLNEKSVSMCIIVLCKYPVFLWLCSYILLFSVHIFTVFVGSVTTNMEKFSHYFFMFFSCPILSCPCFAFWGSSILVCQSIYCPTCSEDQFIWFQTFLFILQTGYSLLIYLQVYPLFCYFQFGVKDI